MPDGRGGYSGPYQPNPSITNIIGVMDKPFLPPYYARLVAEYAVDNLESLKFSRDRFGRDMAVGSAKAVVNLPHPNAAIGDEVHDAIDRWVKSGQSLILEDFEFSTSTAENMFRQFLNFMAVRQPEVVRSEYTVWSYKYGYAGTGDLLWRDQGKLCVVDTKTGTNVHPEVTMQTMAIAMADVILDEDGTEHPIGWGRDAMPDLYVLHVRPRSVKLHKLGMEREAWRTFLACKQIFDWKTCYAAEAIESEPFKTEHKKGE